MTVRKECSVLGCFVLPPLSFLLRTAACATIGGDARLQASAEQFVQTGIATEAVFVWLWQRAGILPAESSDTELPRQLIELLCQLSIALAWKPTANRSLVWPVVVLLPQRLVPLRLPRDQPDPPASWPVDTPSSEVCRLYDFESGVVPSGLVAALLTQWPQRCSTPPMISERHHLSVGGVAAELSSALPVTTQPSCAWWPSKPASGSVPAASSRTPTRPCLRRWRRSSGRCKSCSSSAGPVVLVRPARPMDPPLSLLECVRLARQGEATMRIGAGRSVPLARCVSIAASAAEPALEKPHPRSDPSSTVAPALVEVFARLFSVLPMEQRKHDIFITHAQGSGQDQCKWVYEKLTQAGYSVWYDMKESNLTAQGMEEGVSQCRVVLIFLSDSYFTRPFCLKELRWAKLYGCVLAGLVEKDTRHGPADFGLEMRRAPDDLKHVLADVEFLEYQRRSFLAKAMLEELFRRFGPPVWPAG